MYKPRAFEKERYGELDTQALNKMHDNNCWGHFDCSTLCFEMGGQLQPQFSDRMLEEARLYKSADIARDLEPICVQLVMF